MANFKRIVNVVPLTRVNLDSPQIFSYLVPLQMQGQTRPGQVVKIPFGGNRTIFGVISSFEMHRLPGEVKGLKNLTALVDASPWLTEQNLALANWLAEYYLNPLGVVIKALLPKPMKKTAAPDITALEKFDPDFVLTEAQRLALNEIISRAERTGSFLLLGPRGSGKTEVCLQIAGRLIEADKQVIFLAPDMESLNRIKEHLFRRFGADRVAFLHSQLRDSERLWEWKKIANEEKAIVLGTRSAVFAPVKNLGAIFVLDEQHSSYKQYAKQPKYDARRVAKKLSALWRCPVIFSATSPTVDLYYEAATGKAARLEFPNRIKADLQDPRVKVVAVSADVADGKAGALSPALLVDLTQTLLRQQSALLVFTKAQAGRLTDELHDLFVEEFRRGRPQVVRLTSDQILVEPGRGSPLGLVGVTDADFYLRWTDFRAAERAYHFLHGLADRLGPGKEKEPGVLLLQTSRPDHDVMQALKLRSYDIFFEAELKRRKAANDPPFSRLVKLTAGQKVRAIKFPAEQEFVPPALLKQIPKGADIDVDPESLI